MPIDFDFKAVSSIEFGVGRDEAGHELFRRIAVDADVQAALKEMAGFDASSSREKFIQIRLLVRHQSEMASRSDFPRRLVSIGIPASLPKCVIQESRSRSRKLSAFGSDSSRYAGNQ